MDNIIVFLQSRAGIAIISVVVTAVTGLALLSPRLRITQKAEFKKVIGKQIAEASMHAWEILNHSKVIEQYEIAQDNEDKIIRVFDLGIYPSIMNDMESLTSFFSEVTDFRKKEEYFISRRSAAYMCYIEKYLVELLTFVRAKGMQEMLPELGCIIIYDIQKWHQSFERVLINDINRHRVKVSKHKGFLWNRRLQQIIRKLHEHSMLVIMQKEYEDLNKRDYEVKRIIDQFFDDMTEKEEN